MNAHTDILTLAADHRTAGARSRRRAFSLQEVMIAVGVLGIGLILIAGVFPVALSQHRDTVEGLSARTLAKQVQAELQAKVDIASSGTPRSLWRPATNGTMSAGQDSPWLLLPTPNVAVRLPAGYPATPLGSWTTADLRPGFFGLRTLNYYANLISNPNLSSALFAPADNASLFDANDMLSDLESRINDRAVEEQPFRLVWSAFYRHLASDQFEFAVAVCRQTRGEIYWQQALPYDTGLLAPLADPRAAADFGWRLPVPWRITVYRQPNENRSLRNAMGVPIGELAPPGARLIVHGLVYTPSGSPPAGPVPSGQVLRVTATGDVSGNPSNPELRVVDLAEDISSFPANPYQFDVWVFPPPSAGLGARGTLPPERFGDKSPLIDWFRL